MLENGGWKGAYCNATQVPVFEHIVPQARDGANRVSTLTIACTPCHDTKGTPTAAEFGSAEIPAQAKQPVRDAAAVNARVGGLPPTQGGGNRTRRELPKTHWLDAACVGASTPAPLRGAGIVPLGIMATGRHSRQRCRTNASGFPDKAPKATRVVGGFRTGAIVRAIVRAIVPQSSTKAGTYVGRLAVRATGSCNLKTAAGTLQGIHVRYCRPIHRADGYPYASQKGTAALPPQP